MFVLAGKDLEGAAIPVVTSLHSAVPVLDITHSFFFEKDSITQLTHLTFNTPSTQIAVD